ncbi:MAG: adenylate/guanylate cyclase domain-containing protein [Acidimicrobiales bacterium]
MVALVIHAVAFTAVNGFLVFLWLVLGGDQNTLELAWNDPAEAVRDGFWPLWVIASWGVGLTMHAGSSFAFCVFGRRGRRRRHELSRVLQAQLQRKDAWVRNLATVAFPTTEENGRRFVAVMFTDVAHSTELAEKLGDEAWTELLRQHRGIVRDAMAAHRGKEVGTQGDGFLLRFTEPSDAVTCAVAIQQATQHAKWPEDVEMQVRIGIHAGEAVAADGDLVGRVINLAYRVAAAAEAGEILITEQVADRVARGTILADRGLRELKGVGQSRHLLSVTWSEQPADHAAGELA